MRLMSRSLTWRTDAEAVAAIKHLPQRFWQTVGCIVWWDFFAGRLVANRTALFDPWIMARPKKIEPTDEELLNALLQLGYERPMAEMKFKGSNARINKQLARLENDNAKTQLSP